jgi:hypothetical protein
MPITIGETKASSIIHQILASERGGVAGTVARVIKNGIIKIQEDGKWSIIKNPAITRYDG